MENTVNKVIMHSSMLPFNSMFKSQIESTDIYSQGSQTEKIVLRLESVDPKWPSLFLNPQGSDFKIIHKAIIYPVHRNIIFKNMNLHVLDDEDSEGSLRVPDNLKSELLTRVLSYLYGLELKILRSQALDLLDIAHFLKISRLKRILQDDFLNNFDEYQLFPLLERARRMGLEDVEAACLQQLDLQAFEQMRYAKYELLGCSQQLFKDIIHLHNERRWEDPAFGLSDKFIQQLIQEYCKHNNFTQRKKSQLIKSFNEMSVKSDQPLPGNVGVPSLKLKESNQINIKIYTPRAPSTGQALSPLNYFKSKKSEDINPTKSMIMDLSFMSAQRRRKSSKGSETQSSKVCSDVINLKQTNKKHDAAIDQLKDNIQRMEKSLSLKEAEAKNNKIRLSEIQISLQTSENLFMEDNRRFRLLEAKFNKIQQRKQRYSEQTEDSSIIYNQEDSDDDKQQKKSENPKDQNLRVSLIQSKWVCC